MQISLANISLCARLEGLWGGETTVERFLCELVLRNYCGERENKKDLTI